MSAFIYIFLSILFLIEYNQEKSWNFFDLSLDPIPLFHEEDPRIRIKMKRIRNTGVITLVFCISNCINFYAHRQRCFLCRRPPFQMSTINVEIS